MPSPDDQVNWEPEAVPVVDQADEAELGPRTAAQTRPSRAVPLLMIVLLVLVVVAPSLWRGVGAQLGLVDGSYKFIAVQPGNSDEPITYQSCQPINYLVDDRQAIPGGQQLIDEAVGRVSAATGLRFISLGLLSQDPETGRLVGPTVRIAWTDAEHESRLAGPTVGVGGSRYPVGRPGRVYYVGGQIQLDAPDLTEMLERDGPAEVRAIVMHELGHVVGLDHVDDRNELMYEKNIGKTDFGPGDQRGLALLGQGGCAGAG